MAGRQKGNDGPEKGRAPVSIAGTTKGALQGGTTALKKRWPGKKANAGEFFVKNKNVGGDAHGGGITRLHFVRS
jgi:hypothetical protein